MSDRESGIRADMMVVGRLQFIILYDIHCVV